MNLKIIFLTKGLKKTWEAIKKHKWLFVLLFFIQLAFLIVFVLIQLKYQVAMAQNFNNIIAPLQEANYNETQLQMGLPFMENALQVVQAWGDLKSNFSYLAVFSFLTFIIFCGLNWSLSHYILKKQNFLKLWGKFAAGAAMFCAAYLILVYAIFSSPLFFEDPITSAKIMIGLAVIFAYFVLLFFSSIDSKFREIFKKVFWKIGIKRFYFVLLVYLISALVLALLGYLLFLSVNFWHISLVALFLLLLILALNFLRIFLISSLSEIN